MLCSPTADANGYSTLFQPSDFLALRAGGNCRAAATEANEWMCAAAQYLAAYGSRIDSLIKAKQLDNFDVRLVMFTHSKKAKPERALARLLESLVSSMTTASSMIPNSPSGTSSQLRMPSRNRPLQQQVVSGSLACQ